MYEMGCDEQLIFEKTGYRSVAVCSYKMTSNHQLKQVSDILYGNQDQCNDTKGPEVKVAKSKPTSTISKSPVESVKNEENTPKPSASIEGDCQGVQIAKGVTLNININVSK